MTVGCASGIRCACSYLQVYRPARCLSRDLNPIPALSYTKPMPQPISLPVVPSQPDTKAYGFAALNLFTDFTRETPLSPKAPNIYDQVFGQQAPPCNPNLPTKAWFDTTPQPSPDTIVSYLVFDLTQNPPKQVTLSMTAAQAATPNLPGPYNYPPFHNSPTTPAMNTGPNGQGPNVPMNGALLSDHQHALDVVNAVWGREAAMHPPTEAVYESQVSWNGETRKQWNIDVPGGSNFNAAAMLDLMWGNGQGVQYNGTWDFSNPDNPKWVPNPPADQYAHGNVPTPGRAMLPNEIVQAGPAGMGWELVRTDLP
jgi:hypothetical protein